MLNESELGKWKIEYIIRNAYFVAPKVYYLEATKPGSDEEVVVKKFKGLNDTYVTKSHYQELLETGEVKENTPKKSTFNSRSQHRIGSPTIYFIKVASYSCFVNFLSKKCFEITNILLVSLELNFFPHTLNGIRMYTF